MLDVSEAGSIVINTGKTTAPSTSRHGRRIELTRRVKVAAIKRLAINNPHDGGATEADRVEAEVLGVLDRAEELGQPTCALDVAEEHGTGMTLEEIADLMSITRERVRQVEVKGLARLAGEDSTGELRIAVRELPGEPQTIWDRMGD